MAPRNVARAEECFQSMVLNIVTVSPYLGGFIEDRVVEKSWLYRKVEG